MLERLQLTNFQKHRRFRLILDPSLTVIVGPSDRGKSAIIRAIRWLALNRPLGDEFINWDEEGLRCEVRAWVDGHVVARAKDKNENTYELDGKVFKSFGADVPAEIKALLNVCEINFSDQLDDPYWFKEPPAQVSRNLNSIVNLEVIDETLGTLISHRKKAIATLEVTETRLVQAKERVKALAYISKMDTALRAVEKLDDASYTIATSTAALRRVATAAREANSTGRAASRAAAAGQGVVALGERAIALRWHADTLRTAGQRASEAKKAAGVRVPDLAKLKAVFDKAVKLRTEANALRGMFNGTTFAENRVNTSAAALAKARKEFREKVGDTCPICGNPLKLSE